MSLYDKENFQHGPRDDAMESEPEPTLAMDPALEPPLATEPEPAIMSVLEPMSDATCVHVWEYEKNMNENSATQCHKKTCIYAL